MTAIQRFALHGTIMNPHSSGPYVRHEDHLAAMQGRCLAQIDEPAPATFMTKDRACEWAWDKVREEVGTKGWTTGDSCNFYGFFLHGWNYRGQYELQRSTAMAALKQELMTAAPALEAPAAPARQPLTNEQIEAAFQEGRAIFDRMHIARTDIGLRLEFGRAVERAVLAAAPQAPAAPSQGAEGWAIDKSTSTDILVYKGCSVIEDEQAHRLLALLSAAPAAPSDAQLLSEWDRVSGITEATKRRLACMRAVLQRWGSTAPAAPAVDESFEDLISDWAHGDALDAEHYRTLSQAARDVLAERRRQVNAEGFSPERDDQYVGGQLAGAAISYLILAAGGREDEARAFWPWRQEWLKPGSQRRYLEKACALGLAEMERQDRAAAAKKGGEV